MRTVYHAMIIEGGYANTIWYDSLIDMLMSLAWKVTSTKDRIKTKLYISDENCSRDKKTKFYVEGDGSVSEKENPYLRKLDKRKDISALIPVEVRYEAILIQTTNGYRKFDYLRDNFTGEYIPNSTYDGLCIVDVEDIENYDNYIRNVFITARLDDRYDINLLYPEEEEIVVEVGDLL